MRKSQFTDQQAAFALKQAEGGTPAPGVCRKMGVSKPTFYRWKQKYGGQMSARGGHDDEAVRCRQDLPDQQPRRDQDQQLLEHDRFQE
jgi:hypothetical protein